MQNVIKWARISDFFQEMLVVIGPSELELFSASAVMARNNRSKLSSCMRQIRWPFELKRMEMMVTVGNYQVE